MTQSLAAIFIKLRKPATRLTLFLRKSSKPGKIHSPRIRVIEGDVLDSKKLNEAMVGQDVVYANLSGALDKQARNIVKAMDKTGVKRLIFIMIGQYLPPFRKSADIIEASDLDYTILRPAWLTDNDEIDYETTPKGEPFKGTEVSRKSVAALVVKLIETPAFGIRANLGVNQPNTDGDKPAFY